MVSSSKRQRESLSGRIQLLIEAMDRLGVRLERASRGPSLSLGPVKRMFDASHNEAATATSPATVPVDGSVRAGRCLDQTTFTPSPTDATVLTVVNGAAFDPGDLIRTNYGAEVMRVRQISGNVLTVDRGYGNTPRVRLMALAELVVMGNTGDDIVSSEFAVSAPEDVIDPHAAPVYRGPSTDDVENHLLCVVTPERSSYIRPTGKPGRYEQVWFDGSVTASPFSDGALRQCAVSKDWAMVYEPAARELVGLPALAELDHCREV